MLPVQIARGEESTPVTSLHMYQGSELELRLTERKGERLFARIAGGKGST